MTTQAFHQATPLKSKNQDKARETQPAPAPLARLLPPPLRSSPLLWGLASELLSDDTRQLVTDLDQVARSGRPAAKYGKNGKKRAAVATFAESDWSSRLETWLAGLDDWHALPVDQRPGPLLLEAIAWCHALPQLASMIHSPLPNQLHARLQQLMRDSAGQLPAIPPWTFHLAAELGCTLAYHFPDDPIDAGWDEPSREALTHGICELTDGEGQLHARHLPWIYPLLACWTRCEFLSDARHSGRSCFLQEGEEQYRWFVQQALRWTRRDGNPLSLTGVTGQPHGLRELWQAVLKMQDDPATRFLAAVLLPRRWELTRRRDAQPKDSAEPSPSIVAEWAEVAILRSTWQRSSPNLAVTFDDGEIRSELSLGKRVLWSGPHLPRLTVDGVLLENEGPADLVCTFSDEDGEYIEIELDYPGDWRLQRQILLGREDQFLLIADAILGTRTAELRYQHTLPLVEDVAFEEAPETHEGWLVQDDRRLALVLPLALPEWRSAPGTGRLGATRGGLTLSQQASGTALFCPLFLDLSSKRRSRPATWRRLTVAERLQIQPPDTAVGYRVQIGKQQWLIYRSLRQPGARTVLGQHFSQEFVMGRFTPEGELQQILQIE
jgi:hypothetical protein